MSELVTAAILGIIEGLTEFLPVSSSGHLILAGALLNFEGERAKTFEIVIQIGAILAIVWLYWGRFWGLLFPKKNYVGKAPLFSGIRGLYLLFLTSLPAGLLGLLLHSQIKMLFNPYTVIASLVVGALCMIYVENKSKKINIHTIDQLDSKTALGIGCFQCLSLCPGFSRSASSIMGAMLLGTSRSVAAEYSFLAAVPLIVAAAGYDLLKSWDLFSKADIPLFAIGILTAFISALFAVKIFTGLVSRVTLKPFAYYRIALAFVFGWILLA